MRSVKTEWILLCMLFGCFAVDVDADPNEHFEMLVGSSSEYMQYEFFDGVLEKLHDRLPNISECFDHEKFHDIIPHVEQLSKHLFFNASRAIANIIADEGCLGHLDTSKIPDGHVVVESLRHLDYHGLHDTASCFGEETLERESGDGLTTAVVLYLYQGYCLLPEKDYFATEYMKYFIDTDGDSTKESFLNVMQQLGIGEQQAHHGHDHRTSDSHDHKDRSDGHNHDEDDHSGRKDGAKSEKTDADHDDHEHDDDHRMNETDRALGTTAGPMNATDNTDDDHRHRNDSAHEEHDHEHDHDHSRRKRSLHEDEVPRCYTGEQLAEIYGIGSMVSESQALEICPALIQQIISGACNSTEESHGRDKSKYTQAMIYGYGIVSVIILTLLAILGLLMFPVLESKAYKMTMQFFVGLGIGTLASDAMIHILPNILGVHDHGAQENHDHAAGEEDMTFVWQMSLVMGGLYLGLVFENLLKAVKRSQAKKEKAPGNGGTPEANDDSVDGVIPLEDLTETKGKMGSKFAHGSDEMLMEQNIVCWFFNPTLITVFIGDVLHNFADGVAVGVSFASHWSTGISTSIAILFHELPHELGDFAIYLRHGATKWKAIGLNFCAACFNFIGLFSGINMASDENVRRWLLCIIAGIFLYISLVQVMSLMLREVSKRPVLLFVVQNAGLLLGWMILLLIALYEGRIRIHA